MLNRFIIDAKRGDEKGTFQNETLSAVAQRYRALGKAFKQLSLYNRVLVRTGLDSVWAREAETLRDAALWMIGNLSPMCRLCCSPGFFGVILTVTRPLHQRLDNAKGMNDSEIQFG